MPQTHRIEKVNELIRAEISNMLLREAKDPRLSGYISINAVETTPDLRYARVLVSCVCEEERKKEILEALGHSSGFFRSNLAKRLKIRRIPELHFSWDSSIERGANLLAYMDRVIGEKPPADEEK
ncbi:MAG: 30S ribosome-binding factor RbfA [Dehalococcoidales bacterium]|nr:30S ribosome-binding factor RbfA [Dehalococcoidales bacterium]